MTDQDAGHLRGSVSLLAGRVFAIVLSLIFQVVITRYLPPSEFGLFAYGISLAVLIQNAASLGQEQAVSRFLVLYEEGGRVDRVFGTIVLYVATVLTVGTLAVLALILGIGDLSGQLGASNATAVVAILILLAPIDSLDRLLEASFAVAGKTRAIFVRKYIANPLLKLAVAALVVVLDASVVALAIGTVLAGVAGLTLYATQLGPLRRQLGLVPLPTPDVPTREILGFSVPLLTNELVILSVASGAVAIIGWFGDSSDVAAYRVIWPAARLNLVVLFTFSVLFLPSITRLYARRATTEMHDEYWRTAAWMSALTLPIHLVTGPFAETTTVVLFGEQYRTSGWILAVLSSALYLGVVLGFSQHTLQIHARIRRVVVTNLVIAAAHVGLAIALISARGARGAAVAGAIAIVARIVANHRGVAIHTPVRAYERDYARLHASIVAVIGFSWVISTLSDLPAVVDFAIATIATAAVVRFNRRRLRIADTFPELGRLPGLRLLLD